MASAPISPPLPVLKPDSVFTDTHWQVLFALLDAIIPSVVSGPPSKGNNISITEDEFHNLHESLQQSMKCPPSLEKFRAYMSERPSDNAEFVENVKHQKSLLLGVVLTMPRTRLGSLISTWYLTPLVEQPLQIKEAILKSWQQSWFSLWPILARTFVFLAKTCWSQSNQLLHELSGYTRYREDYQSGPTVDFNFVDAAALDQPIIDTDIVIIGSGCGGGVCAKVLSEAGHRVLVVDKGHYYPPNYLPMPIEGLEYLFQGGGAIASVDGSTYTVTADCWGGGGTVNWSASFQTPDIIRQDWAVNEGLEFFSSPDFQDCLDRVCDFMGVSRSGIRHNYANRTLLGGAGKLGWKAEAVSQNTRGAEHNCGSRCGLGCSAAQKQGPAVSWLPAAGRAGARFMEGLDVEKVLFDDANGIKKATGIVGKWISREGVQQPVTVKAKRVIVSAGAINTPLTLLRSGLKNPNVGDNLHLHPTGNLVGVFDEDIRGWEGEIITSMVSEFENLDGKGYGTRLETCNMLPHYALFGLPWHSALQFKMDALKLRQTACFMSLARDRTAGRVSPGPDGYPTITYSPCKSDRSHLVAGMVALAKLSYIQGATELFALLPGVPSFKCITPTEERNLEDTDLVAWIKKLENADLKPSSAVYGSAHQMGTCRMSTSERAGVVDQNGKVWGAEGLYVADASVFPSASGTNPMITVMAIADHIARGIAAAL
ncbi:hypothetical protein AAE478_004138 [Parahypoxylon ruwenzoriense]